MSNSTFVRIEYEFNCFDPDESSRIIIWTEGGKVHYSKKCFGIGDLGTEDTISNMTFSEFLNEAGKLDIPGWNKHYEPATEFVVMDGSSWTVKYEDGNVKVKRTGENAYPSKWRAFKKLINTVVKC